MKDDQWFEPGDKVMRVAYANDIGLTTNGILISETDFGRVLCVSSCEEMWCGNVVNFVGVPIPKEGGFYARCFRKVDEIKLCIRAIEKKPNELEVEV